MANEPSDDWRDQYEIWAKAAWSLSLLPDHLGYRESDQAGLEGNERRRIRDVAERLAGHFAALRALPLRRRRCLGAISMRRPAHRPGDGWRR
jgi:hypothetical protein